MPISSFYYYIQADQIIPSIPSHSRVSRIHQLLFPNPLILFNSPSPATVQKPVNFISHICGLGASVGCERVERTFNTPRLKAQICLMKFTGFVCSLSNELNSKTSFYSTMQMFVFWCFVWHKLDSCDKVSNQCRARLNLRQYLFVQEQLRKGTGW